MRTDIIGTSPPATAVGVGTLTGKLSVVQSPLTARPGSRDVTAMAWAARFDVALLVLWSGLRGLWRLSCWSTMAGGAPGRLW